MTGCVLWHMKREKNTPRYICRSRNGFRRQARFAELPPPSQHAVGASAACGWTSAIHCHSARRQRNIRPFQCRVWRCCSSAVGKGGLRRVALRAWLAPSRETQTQAHLRALAGIRNESARAPLFGNVARVHFGNGWLQSVRSAVAAARVMVVSTTHSLSSFGPGFAFTRGSDSRERDGFSAAARRAPRLAALAGGFPGGLDGVVHHEAEEALLVLQELVWQEANRRIARLSGQRPLAQHVICRDVNGLSQPAVEQWAVHGKDWWETCGRDAQ